MGPDGAVNNHPPAACSKPSKTTTSARRSDSNWPREIRANIDPYIAAGHAQLDDRPSTLPRPAPRSARGPAHHGRTSRFDRPWAQKPRRSCRCERPDSGASGPAQSTNVDRRAPPSGSAPERRNPSPTDTVRDVNGAVVTASHAVLLLAHRRRRDAIVGSVIATFDGWRRPTSTGWRSTPDLRRQGPRAPGSQGAAEDWLAPPRGCGPGLSALVRRVTVRSRPCSGKRWGFEPLRGHAQIQQETS